MEVRDMDELNQDPNQNNKGNNRFTKIKGFLSKVVDKDGFFVILFICICIVATTAVWVVKNNIDNINSIEKNNNLDMVDNPNMDEDLSMTEEVDSQQDSDIKLIDINEDPETEETKDNEADASEEQKTKVLETSASSQEKILSAMIIPLAGSILTDFADDRLVYSKTLEQWTTHNGIDIKAKEGSAIRAVQDGIVSQIKKDPELGIVIVIDHGNGISTKYGNLSTDEMVKKDQEIKKGDPISGVAKGTGFEMVEGPHLHFEVLKDGKNIDPKPYLPKFQ